ncbi:hypothetical protein [Pseudooceanicola algae]|uniref:Uncharacterized protein n=1 Tax=Pseudooceanicola algae TaxID=1537215 RepID=A0A418SL11_9RHOB|nr:hypothetical protein [Pseudooceanicola algae]QPM90900.1 hypothetical protein PSAL_021420 [Pseudooceanicola algae]
MKHLFKFVSVLCVLVGFTGSVQADQCDDLYEAARKACGDVRHACDDIKICNGISADCKLVTDTEAGCTAYGTCVQNNTPTIYRNACGAVWNAQSGQCMIRGFASTQRIIKGCPYPFSRVAERCMPVATALSDQQQACQAARRALAERVICDKPSVRMYDCKMP